MRVPRGCTAKTKDVEIVSRRRLQHSAMSENYLDMKLQELDVLDINVS
jgi:hypothetical protein